MRVLRDVSFEASGLACRVVQCGVLLAPHWCGYVTLPPGHPWHGWDYDDIPVDTHGGLTYGSPDGDGYRIGFDCAHAGDGWQDEAWVRAEVERLAEQCANLVEGGAPDA